MMRKNIVRLTLIVVLGASCALGLSYCLAVGESHSFSTAAEFKASEEYDRWGPDVVPDGSEQIETWHDIDSNSVRTSFIYRGARPLRSTNMQTLAPGLKGIAVSAYPLLGDGKKIDSTQYRCDRTVISLDSTNSATYSEVEFVGDTGEMVYYWNTHVDATYDRICQPVKQKPAG